MKIVRRRSSVLKRLGLILTWLGVLALMIPSPGSLPNPSLILLPTGILLYTIAWIRKE